MDSAQSSFLVFLSMPLDKINNNEPKDAHEAHKSAHRTEVGRRIAFALSNRKPAWTTTQLAQALAARWGKENLNTNVNKIVQGGAGFSAFTAKEIADVLGLNLDWLLVGGGYMYRGQSLADENIANEFCVVLKRRISALLADGASALSPSEMDIRYEELITAIATDYSEHVVRQLARIREAIKNFRTALGAPRTADYNRRTLAYLNVLQSRGEEVAEYWAETTGTQQVDEESLFYAHVHTMVWPTLVPVTVNKIAIDRLRREPPTPCPLEAIRAFDNRHATSVPLRKSEDD